MGANTFFPPVWKMGARTLFEVKKLGARTLFEDKNFFDP